MTRLLTCAAVVVASAASAADDPAPAGWGAVKGRVVWKGDPLPQPKPVKVTKDQDHCLARAKVLLDNDLIVDRETRGVRDVFVWLADPENATKPLPIHPSLKELPKPAEIDQPCCLFEPRCLILREGQKLLVKNSAPISHSFRLNGRFTTINRAMQPNETLTIDKIKAERTPLSVVCDFHPWMGARIGVFSHPYAVLTDKTGAFEIRNAPAGDWRLFVLHDKVGWLGGEAGGKGRKVTIQSDGTADLGKLEMEPPKE